MRTYIRNHYSNNVTLHLPPYNVSLLGGRIIVPVLDLVRIGLLWLVNWLSLMSALVLAGLLCK